MVTFVKRAQVEQSRNWRFSEVLNRVFPLPFEERRSRVGMMPFKIYRWVRYAPVIAFPGLIIGVVTESRQSPNETVLTPFHIWLAHQGVWRLDTIKAVSPQGEQERLLHQQRVNDRKFFLTGGDQLSDREMREFVAINQERKMAKEQVTQLLGPNIPPIHTRTGFGI
eukprot:PhF_6_TR4763/c0_g1_i1/m.6574